MDFLAGFIVIVVCCSIAGLLFEKSGRWPAPLRVLARAIGAVLFVIGGLAAVATAVLQWR